MNKDKIFDALNVKDPEQVLKLKRIIDIANHVNKNYQVQSSDFLSPDLLCYIEAIMFHFRDLSYKIDGGHPDFEYFKLIVYPDYLQVVEDEIAIIDLKYNEKYGVIGHRDVLGALMNLGIKREIIGDILVESNHVQIMADKKMAHYVADQIKRIGRVTVDKEVLNVDKYIAIEPEFKLIDSTVKTVRLDAVVASGFNIPRSKAVDLIKSERVKLNHNVNIQTSKEIKENDLISVRGSGRIRLEQVLGLSKKERVRIKIKKYI